MSFITSKTVYPYVHGKDCRTTGELHDTNLEKGQKLKYLGSIVPANSVCKSEIKTRVQAGSCGLERKLT